VIVVGTVLTFEVALGGIGYEKSSALVLLAATAVLGGLLGSGRISRRDGALAG
jgi:hypothetical protein